MADQAATQDNSTGQQAGGNQQDGGQPQSTDQQAGGGQPQSGDQQAGGQPQDGDQQGASGKGDTRVALRQERAKRKRLEQELARVRGGSGSSTEGSGEDGSEQDRPDFSISEEEQEDPEALSQKLNALHQDAVDRATERVRSEMTASQDVQSEAQSIFDKYSVFNQDDAIGEYATRVAIDSISEMPTGSSMQEIDAVAAQVAKDFDAMQAEAPESSVGDGSGSEGPLTVGAGSAESAHLHPEAAPQNSMKDAGRMAKQEMRQKMQRGASRG